MEQGVSGFFLISDVGIFGEVDEDDYRITEFFRVTGPRMAAEYIELISVRQLSRRSIDKYALCYL